MLIGAKPGPCFNELRSVGYTIGHWVCSLLSYNVVTHREKIYIGSEETYVWERSWILKCMCNKHLFIGNNTKEWKCMVWSYRLLRGPDFHVGLLSPGVRVWAQGHQTPGPCPWLLHYATCWKKNEDRILIDALYRDMGTDKGVPTI